ncbi:hypothetical protein FH972_010494 [Carpinus fangiana]|uniref:Uncharacterized protein n=1 Tax=Carpinus fangiana TaxID=176857 RepID=A0A660KQ76_9ROSI|nr:hypothetical protein FH972_010494 [Carpinus fangiana]
MAPSRPWLEKRRIRWAEKTADHNPGVGREREGGRSTAAEKHSNGAGGQKRKEQSNESEGMSAHERSPNWGEFPNRKQENWKHGGINGNESVFLGKNLSDMEESKSTPSIQKREECSVERVRASGNLPSKEKQKVSEKEKVFNVFDHRSGNMGEHLMGGLNKVGGKEKLCKESINVVDHAGKERNESILEEDLIFGMENLATIGKNAPPPTQAHFWDGGPIEEGTDDRKWANDSRGVFFPNGCKY